MCRNCDLCGNDECTIYDYSICGDPCTECRGGGLSRRTAMTKPGYAKVTAKSEGLCSVIAIVGIGWVMLVSALALDTFFG